MFDQVGQRCPVIRSIDDDDRFGGDSGLSGGVVGCRQQRRHRDVRLRFRVLELPGDLGGRVEGVERGDGCASAEDSVVGDGEFRRVGHLHSDDVAGRDAACCQCSCEGVRASSEFAVREVCVAVGDGYAVQVFGSEGLRRPRTWPRSRSSAKLAGRDAASLTASAIG